MSVTSRACRACRRGCHEDAARKLLSWNLGFTGLGEYVVVDRQDHHGCAVVQAARRIATTRE